MKNILFIEDTPVNKITYYHLAGFLIVLPFDFFYSELVLISLGLHTLIHTDRSRIKNIFRKPVLVLTSIYLLTLAAIWYSPDKADAFNVAGRQLAILIFPLLFSLTGLNLEKYKLQLISIFAFACMGTILYLYADAINTILSLHMPLSSLFTIMFMNHNFSMPIGIHATYLSVYTAFSMLSFLYLFFREQHLLQKWIYIIAVLVLSAGLLQLSSRTVFIASLFIINFLFPFFFFKGKKRVLFFLTASLVSAITLLLINNVDSFKTRYISELKTDLTDSVMIIENTEPRIARWNATLELVKRSPVIGYGTGAEKELLKEKYFEKGLYISFLNEFNAHNEYLSIAIKTGLLGLALFVYVLYFGFAAALKKRDILFLGFMVLIAVVSVSENLLSLNKGIFFYSFFFSLFLIRPDDTIKTEPGNH